jgi:hypothetical protein
MKADSSREWRQTCRTVPEKVSEKVSERAESSM